MCPILPGNSFALIDPKVGPISFYLYAIPYRMSGRRVNRQCGYVFT